MEEVWGGGGTGRNGDQTTEILSPAEELGLTWRAKPSRERVFREGMTEPSLISTDDFCRVCHGQEPVHGAPAERGGEDGGEGWKAGLVRAAGDQPVAVGLGGGAGAGMDADGSGL